MGFTRSRAAFTLIELLVVIAIIGLLASIMLPSVSAARNQAKLLTCATQGAEIATAAQAYAAEHDGYVLRDYNHQGRSHTFWAAHYAAYLGRPIPDDLQYKPLFLGTPDPRAEPEYRDALAEVPVYRCPAAEQSEHVLHYVNNGLSFTEYRRRRQSGRAEVDCYAWSGPSRVANLPAAPSQILQFAEADLDALPADQFDYHDLESPLHLTFGVAGQANQPAEWPHESLRAIHAEAPRHDGKTTVVFFDGHAESRERTPESLPLELFNPLTEQ
jgi:prepilin-type N-terminal cleavage/methylation domain-containing protein/prepilin-type processing-associated H-X9-DG protein